MKLCLTYIGIYTEEWFLMHGPCHVYLCTKVNTIYNCKKYVVISCHIVVLSVILTHVIVLEQPTKSEGF